MGEEEELSGVGLGVGVGLGFGELWLKKSSGKKVLREENSRGKKEDSISSIW